MTQFVTTTSTTFVDLGRTVSYEAPKRLPLIVVWRGYLQSIDEESLTIGQWAIRINGVIFSPRKFVAGHPEPITTAIDIDPEMLRVGTNQISLVWKITAGIGATFDFTDGYFKVLEN